MNAESPAHSPALGPDELDELDTLLDDLRTRAEEIPQWEFCDGFLAALACMRRPVPPAEFLPMLLGDGLPLEVAEGEPLPVLEALAPMTTSHVWPRACEAFETLTNST